MHLIVGLGNPGKKYQLNRHNVGFQCVDRIVKQLDLQGPELKFESESFKGEVEQSKVIALKPQTFMNLSGKTVSKFQNFYKIDPDDIVIIYDDLDVPFGKIKITKGGGDAGHNGLKSINSLIKNEYIKIKIGIGRPEFQNQVESFVLSDFVSDEIKFLEKIYAFIANNIVMVMNNRREDFLNKFAMEIK